MSERRYQMDKHLQNYINSDKKKVVATQQRVRALTAKTCDLIMVDSPCLRASVSDIAILCSHMNTLYTAVHDDSPLAKKSKYFLVLEDDVRFQFHINFESLVNHAPKDFGSIQLMLSHKPHIENVWNKYVQSLSLNESHLFSLRFRNNTFWSAQAILYNKEKIRQFVDYVVTKDSKLDKLNFKLINSFEYGLIKDKSYRFHNPYRPAVACECLFADMYLYSMSYPSYILNIPIFNSALGGVNSSSHQMHVPYHYHGFASIQDIQNGLKNLTYPSPSFISPLKYNESSTDWHHFAKKYPVKFKRERSQII